MDRLSGRSYKRCVVAVVHADTNCIERCRRVALDEKCSLQTRTLKSWTFKVAFPECFLIHTQAELRSLSEQMRWYWEAGVAQSKTLPSVGLSLLIQNQPIQTNNKNPNWEHQQNQPELLSHSAVQLRGSSGYIVPRTHAWRGCQPAPKWGILRHLR